MKTVIREYAGTVISLVATLGLLATVGMLFLGEDGFFAMLITAAMGGV